MKRLAALAGAVVLTFGAVAASAAPTALAPGDTVTFSCATSLSGSFGPQSATLTCATATPAPTPVPTPTPTAAPTAPGLPTIPPGSGTLFLKNFSDGTLAPFRAITYPNNHPGDLMIQYGTFVTDSAHISVANGYLSLKATRNANGTWSQAFVGTGLDGNGGTTNATYKFQYGTVRWAARFAGGTGPGDWRTLWLLVADSWTAPEIDWAEVIGNKFTANLHGSSSNGQKVSMAMDNAWHIVGVVKQPTYIAFTLDGVEVGRANVAMTANMALLADSKVGLTAPTAATPSTLELDIAYVTVDP